MTNDSYKRLVILGPPGAGKGTQGKLLSETLGLRHIASGDLVRQHQANETNLGLKSRAYYSKGLLVPDDITIKMVLPYVLASSEGLILDGFPRNVNQAKHLDQTLSEVGLHVDQTILINTPRGEILERLANRRVCQKCEMVYHTTSAPPVVQGECDVCGDLLCQREDDRPEAIDTRIEEFHAQTKAVADFYRDQNKLTEVNGVGSVDEILQRLLDGLKRTNFNQSLVN